MIVSNNFFPKALRCVLAYCALFALVAFSSTARAQAGYVHEISGAVSVQGAGGKAASLKVGDKFEPNTVFQTGAGAKAVLKFADGQVVALSPDTALRVGHYRYVSDSTKQSASTLELLTGEMRFVTGVTGSDNRDGVRIIAGESTLGLMKSGGADFIVRVKPQPDEAGAIVVAVGEISVRTPYGPVTKIEAGQYAPWQPGRIPPLPVRLSAAPTSVQSSIAGSLAMVLPANRPTEIDAAARTAIAVAADRRAEGPARTDAASAQLRAGGSSGGPIGFIHEISGEVLVQKSAGKAAPAKTGDAFDPNTTFATGFDGKTTLKFADGQVVALGLDSKLRVGDYSFDTSKVAQSTSRIELMQGEMRLVAGVIGAENRKGLFVTAGETTIGVSKPGGADFTVVVDATNVEVGTAAVVAGEITLGTPYYPIAKIAAGEFAPWNPGRIAPLPAPIAAAPAVVQAATAALWETPLPSNTPTVVAIAARAAAATADAKQAQAAASANPQNTQLQAVAAAATQKAETATQAATSAGEAIASAVFEKTLAALPSTAAGPAATVLAGAGATLPPVSIQSVISPPKPTPGGGGGCAGSSC